jgi:hypothetical protein
MENTIDVNALTLADAEWLMYELLKKFDLETFDNQGQKISTITCMHELAIMKKLLLYPSSEE